MPLIGRAIFDNVFKCFFLNTFEGLSLSVERFESFYHGFRHTLVRFGRTPDDGKALALCDALVAVFLVEPDADQVGCRLTAGALGFALGIVV